jgi:parallel beta-helix repeat protein/predicted outer membrane repeat protein
MLNLVSYIAGRLIVRLKESSDSPAFHPPAAGKGGQTEKPAILEKRTVIKAAIPNLVILFLTAAPVLAGPASGSNNRACRRPRYVPDEIIVKFQDTVARSVEKQLEQKRQARQLTLSRDLDGLNARYRAGRIEPVLKDFRQKDRDLRSLSRQDKMRLTQKQKRILRRLSRAPKGAKAADLGRIYRIKFEAGHGRSLQEIAEQYQRNPDVEYAELNYIVSVASIPDDPLYSRQWALDKISAPQTWDVCTGSSEVVVAVIDTGVDYNHRDILENVWVNEAELTGIEGVDDDENGYTDDIYGYNFVYNNNNPIDDHGHGTHCAGTIAARANNGLDVAGVCWSAKIMPLKFLGSRGEGSTADAALAIHYAVANGADVISNSWGGDSESKLLEDALHYAQTQGVVIVAAAGNSGSDLKYYPAAYETVISVAATDPNDDKWALSNYGDWVDIAAPGVDILSLRAEGTSQGTSYDQFTSFSTGTSMAAPHAAGACALLLSANPLLTPHELYGILTKRTDQIAPGICSSDGRLNLFNALRAVIPSKGYVKFDHDSYAQGSQVGILLADWQLKGKRSQQVKLTTRQGDAETIVLTETSSALGVFTATLSAEAGGPTAEDGIIQVSHGELIAAIYFDANDGSGNPAIATASALADYEPPSVLGVYVETRGPAAKIEVVTNEPTLAQIQCGLQCDGPHTFVKKDAAMSVYHSVRLQPLSLDARYYFVLDLVDEAGNKIVDDNDGACYSFTTPAEFLGFYVPGVYPTIQAAVDDTWDGDTVWVADGTYTGQENTDIDFKGKAITVRSENGPLKCIIDCQRRASGFLFHSGEDENSVLDGFTIANGGGSKFGGAIRCTASSPTIMNCIITDSSASDYGGGMYNCYGSNPNISNCIFSRNSSESSCVLGNGGAICNVAGSSPEIVNCTFSRNTASYSGGGVYNHDNSSPTIVNCTFSENSAGRSGGGMISWKSSNVVLTNCTFSRNSAEADGGGLCNYYDSNLKIANCIFSYNSAQGSGGAIRSYNSKIRLTNCTIYGNWAESVGGIWNGPGSSSALSNCILWNNSDGKGADQSAQIADSNEASTASYCCIQGLTGSLAGIGNINVEPLFADTNNEDYHLQSEGWRWDTKRKRWHYDEISSLCLDAGNPGSALANEVLAVPDDPNNVWGTNVRINMGAHGGTAEASMPPHDWALLADLTNDGIVNWHDYAYLVSRWSETAKEQYSDLNRDSVVDIADLALLVESWAKFVKPPTVTIVNPQHGVTLERSGDAVIEVEAEAWDIDSSVVKVEFFANWEKIGEDNDGSDGWRIDWRSYGSGLYRLAAKATDKSGISAFSSIVTITVERPR